MNRPARSWRDVWKRGGAVAAAAGLLALGGVGSVQAAPKPAEAAVNYTALRQVIVGFGASGAFGEAQNLENLPATEQTQVLRLLFSPTAGAGLTIVRNLVNDGQDGETIEPSPGQWDWNILPDDQIWLMQQAETYGVKTFISSAWSPPAWMKANDSVVGGPNDTQNYLLPKDYHAYAVYLAQYVLGYASHFHLPIYAISPQNEPNEDVTYASCVWTPTELDTFMREDLIPVFRQDHVPARIILGEQSYWGEQYALPSLLDPKVAPYISIVAAHGYGGVIAPLTTALAEHKQVWMTEDSTFNNLEPGIANGVQWADTINQFLTVADVSVWNYWWLVTTGGDNEGLINIAGNGQAYPNKRLFTLGNFSRFVRPGFHRIGTSTNPGPGLQLSAYRSPTGHEIAVVVINDTKHGQHMVVHLDHYPLAGGTAVPYLTSAQDNLAREAALPVVGHAFTAWLPAMSVETFVVNGRG